MSQNSIDTDEQVNLEVTVESPLSDVLSAIGEQFGSFHPMMALAEIASTGRLLSTDAMGVPIVSVFKAELRYDAIKQLNLKLTPGFKARAFTNQDDRSAEALLGLTDVALVQDFISVMKSKTEKGGDPQGQRVDPMEAADAEIRSRAAKAKTKELKDAEGQG